MQRNTPPEQPGCKCFDQGIKPVTFQGPTQISLRHSYFTEIRRMEVAKMIIKNKKKLRK